MNLWAMVREDHRANPDALPWVLEGSGCMFCATVFATVLLFSFDWHLLFIGVGYLAVCMALREAVKRWHP